MIRIAISFHSKKEETGMGAKPIKGFRKSMGGVFSNGKECCLVCCFKRVVMDYCLKQFRKCKENCSKTFLFSVIAFVSISGR